MDTKLLIKCFSAVVIVTQLTAISAMELTMNSTFSNHSVLNLGTSVVLHCMISQNLLGNNNDIKWGFRYGEKGTALETVELEDCNTEINPSSTSTDPSKNCIITQATAKDDNPL